MGIICAMRGQQRIGIVGALKFASANAWSVIRVTARLIALTLLTIAPFLAVAGLVYFSLLAEYDINYYLTEKPPAFLVAVGIGGVIVVSDAQVNQNSFLNLSADSPFDRDTCF